MGNCLEAEAKNFKNLNYKIIMLNLEKIKSERSNPYFGECDIY